MAAAGTKNFRVFPGDRTNIKKNNKSPNTAAGSSLHAVKAPKKEAR